MWKAILITQSEVDSGGKAWYTYDLYHEEQVYVPSVSFYCYPSERASVVREKLERLKTEYDIAQEVPENEEIIL